MLEASIFADKDALIEQVRAQPRLAWYRLDGTTAVGGRHQQALPIGG